MLLYRNPQWQDYCHSRYPTPLHKMHTFFKMCAVTCQCQAWQVSYMAQDPTAGLSFSIADSTRHAAAGNPCEEHAPQAMDTIAACLRRNRLGLGNDPLRTPVKSMGEVGTPPTMYHTVQPLGPSSPPDSKEGGPARRVLHTLDKENWALSTGKFRVSSISHDHMHSSLIHTGRPRNRDTSLPHVELLQSTTLLLTTYTTRWLTLPEVKSYYV